MFHSLFTHTHTEAETQREKQAPCRAPDVVLDPETPGSHPRLKAGTKPLSHPGMPVLEYSKLPVWPCCPLPGVMVEIPGPVFTDAVGTQHLVWCPCGFRPSRGQAPVRNTPNPPGASESEVYPKSGQSSRGRGESWLGISSLPPWPSLA